MARVRLWLRKSRLSPANASAYAGPHPGGRGSRARRPRDPASQEAWWYLGFLHYQRDEYALAQDAFSHFLAIVPKAGPASALRGLCEFEMGEYTPALADIQAGLAAGAGNNARSLQTLRFHEAEILTLRGSYEAALASYTAAAHAGPLAPLMEVGLGLAGLRQQRLPSAIPDAEKPLFAAAGEAAALLLMGHSAEGEAAFRGFFAQFPATPNSHFLLGYLLFTQNPERAIAEFRLELAQFPRNLGANSMAAWAFLAENESKNALSYAREAAAIAPGDSFAQLVLGRALVDTGDFTGGLTHLEASRQLDPANLDTHIALAKAYSELGQPEQARAERLRSLELAATDPEQPGNARR